MSAKTLEGKGSMKRLIIVGSPRTQGRSAHLAEMLFEANIDERPEDELFLVPVSEVEIAPCIGCDACRETSGVIVKGDDGKELTLQRHRCIFDDDMQTLYDLLDDADEATVVTPVYFSGAPALLKCLLDRLQPYYWARLDDRERGELPEKRPLALHVLGEGSDPHGYGALVSEVRSAFAVAGFRLTKVLDWVGKIDADGEITAEASEVDFESGLQDGAEGASEAPASDVPPSDFPASDDALKSQTAGDTARKSAKDRPKLNLYSGANSQRDDEPSAKVKGASPKGARTKSAQPKSAQPKSAQPKGKGTSSKKNAKGKAHPNQSRTSKQPSKGARNKRGRRG